MAAAFWKPKNPLSPFWSTYIFNDDTWHGLIDFEQIKGWPRKVDEHAMAKAAAAMRADATGDMPTPSNLAWATIGHEIEPLARLHLAVRDDEFTTAAKNGADVLSAWFDNQIRDTVEKAIGASDGLDRVMKQRCDFAARYCIKKLSTPIKSKRKLRGRDRDLNTADMDLADRQKQAFTRTQRHRGAVTMWNLQKEMYLAIKATGSINKTDFIKNLAPTSKTAAYKHWDEACKRLGLEFREGAYRENAKPMPVIPITLQPALPSASTIVSGPPVLKSVPQHPKIIDIGCLDPGQQSSRAGPRDPQRHNHASRLESACPDAASHVLLDAQVLN